MTRDGSEGLCRILVSHLSPWGHQPHTCQPERLDILCLRSAAVYATTALYEYHANSQHNQQHDQVVDEALWEAVFPSLDSHFLRLIPVHHYEHFLDNVLSALEVACHYDENGRALMQYVVLFFPKQMKKFKLKRCYKDRVLMPTICCLHRCMNLEELYLGSADSASISTYLLSHILKFMSELKVLSLPKQADDDVLSVIGMNCTNLESIVLNSTSVTNLGLSWLLCCRKLHTVIMKGNFQGVTPKGVALLLNGLEELRHLVYDVFLEVLTYLDFNSSGRQKFQLRTVLFNSMELLGSNHMELITKVCPKIEWLSLDSALTYNLEGLGRFNNLRFLKLNYKGRSIDGSVVNFFNANASSLQHLHLIDIRDLTKADLLRTVGRCYSLETLVLEECSLAFNKARLADGQLRVEHLQLLGLQQSRSIKDEFWDFMSLFQSCVKVIDMDICPLDAKGLETLLTTFSPHLEAVRCPLWSNLTKSQLKAILGKHRKIFPNSPIDLQISKQAIFDSDKDFFSHKRRTTAAKLLAEHVGISPILSQEAW